MSDMYTWENVIFIPTSEAAKNAIGKECYFGDSPASCLADANKGESLGILERVNPESIYPFHRRGSNNYGCIILKREPSYAERASKWIEDNDLKVGDYVRVTRRAKTNEGGWAGIWLDGLMAESTGEVLKFEGVRNCNCSILLEDGFYYPYFVLEKAEPPEPKHVPFTSMEEFAAAYEIAAKSYNLGTLMSDLRCNGMWIRCKKDRGVYQVLGMLDSGVMVAGFKEKKTWKELFDEFEFLNTEPCGKEE